MTRSLLQPIRTRRVGTAPMRPNDADAQIAAMTPGTRKTLAAIGALWVSFATSAAGTAAALRPVPASCGNPSDTPAAGADLESLAK